MRVLVVALLVLISPHLVMADCAWVLWKKSEAFPAPRGVVTPNWDIESAVPEYDACMRMVTDSVETYLKPSPSLGGETVRKTQVGNHRVSISSDRNPTTILTFLCLPSGVDPRGPR